MAWSYIRLWKLLLDKGMKRIDLAAAAHLTPNTLASLGKRGINGNAQQDLQPA